MRRVWGVIVWALDIFFSHESSPLVYWSTQTDPNDSVIGFWISDR